MKIGLVQYNPVWEDKDRNKEKISGLIANNLNEASLLIFPEMTLTGFTMQAEKFAEEIDGKSFKYFASAAKEKKCNILYGIIEQSGDDYFNTLVHVDDSGSFLKKYRKIHPFSYSTENRHYRRGEETVVTEINGFKTGLSICYDLRFPELYRKYGKERTDLIVVIANWPVARIEHWRTLLKARAIENQCYIAGVNRIGTDPKLSYNGFSSIFDPMGVELITSENEEKILTAEISKEKVEEIRSSLPFLNDIFLI